MVDDKLRETAANTRRGVLRLSRRMRAERPHDALSNNKIAVLAHLSRHGPSTPGEISAAEYQQPQSLTRVFAELERGGLVARVPNGRDKRGTVLNLTKEGYKVLSADMGERDRWLTQALSELNETEIQILGISASLLTRLADTRGV